jgi:hypothetical protein
LSGRDIVVRLQRRFETGLGVFEAVELQINLTEIYGHHNVFRSQTTGNLEATDSLLEASLQLVQFGEEIDPAKILWRQAAGVEVTLLGRRNQRIRVIDFPHRPIGLAKQGIG